MQTGYLVLETGDIFEGKLIGDKKDISGEVVFNTSMTGYQEIITDPSYAGQIVTFCYPLIGNYGINLMDDESAKPHLAAVVVGEWCERPSHYLSNLSFGEQLVKLGIAGLCEIDTRALVKTIRKHGPIKGVITDNLTKELSFASEIEPENINLVKQVSLKEIKTYENNGQHIALVDYGFKKSILDNLLAEDCKVTVVPYSFSYAQMKALNPDGVVFSNGPGDPRALDKYLSDVKKICETFPALGICLGHQVIALAFGCESTKMKYGHRGANHPIREIATGKVFISSQNHGYMLTEESIDLNTFEITHKNINDNTIEGIKHKNLLIETVQFHPEAHPGPVDSAQIFHHFIQKLIEIGDLNYAVT